MFWRIYWVAIVVVMLSTAVIPRLWYQRSAKRPARRHPRRRPTERQELVVDRTVDQVRTAVFEAMRLTKIRVVPSSSPEAIRGLTRASWGTWGTLVTVWITPRGAGTHLEIEAAPSLPTVLWDLGDCRARMASMTGAVLGNLGLAETTRPLPPPPAAPA